VPIIWKMVEENREGRVLEVGNVLAHYFLVSHDVLDKYEGNEGVINQDVADFQTSKKYDLIVSISTLEHVGWDEFPRAPQKILCAIDNLKSILTPGGKIAVTIPLGYNPVLDGLLSNGKTPFTRQFFMKRVSRDNQWEEADWTDVADSKYNFYISSNGLLIGIIEGQDVLTASYQEGVS
jgi:SAM-dependent methyltransferase